MFQSRRKNRTRRPRFSSGMGSATRGRPARRASGVRPARRVSVSGVRPEARRLGSEVRPVSSFTLEHQSTSLEEVRTETREIYCRFLQFLASSGTYILCLPRIKHTTLSPETRSSAQGNCSAKSLAGNVIDSSLSSLSSAGWGPAAGGSGQGGGGGQGTFHPPCHILHYHMVLRPKGTSHNKDAMPICENVLISVVFQARRSRLPFRPSSPGPGLVRRSRLRHSSRGRPRGRAR